MVNGESSFVKQSGVGWGSLWAENCTKKADARFMPAAGF